MNFNASLSFSEICSLWQTQAEVNRCGVKVIELSTQNELSVEHLALHNIDHIVGERFIYSVVPVGIGVGYIAEFDVTAAKSEMVTLLLDNINDATFFPETIATRELSEHYHKKLIPAGEGLCILISTVLLDDSIENSLRQKLNELVEKVFFSMNVP